MKPLLLTIALLFSTTAWADEDNVAGNSFYCEPPDSNGQAFVAIEFKNNYSIHYWEDGTRKTQGYNVGPLSVSWSPVTEPNWKYTLNRKNLVLNLFTLPDYRKVIDWQCKFMDINFAKNKLAEERDKRDKRLREGNKF